jgi:hypothetical protein
MDDFAGARTADLGRVYADILAAYLRWAACLETPSIAPISDQDRSALRASRIASSKAVSMSSRCSASSAMVRSAAVRASTRSSGSTSSAHRSSAAARCARVVMVSTNLSGTWVAPASSVSNPRQWCRSAWSMSSSETPCLRALASMSTASGYAAKHRASTSVDVTSGPCSTEHRRRRVQNARPDEKNSAPSWRSAAFLANRRADVLSLWFS